MVDPVRIKVFNDSSNEYGVWLSQNNVSDYEDNVTYTLTARSSPTKFVELENRRSSGWPDVKGYITRNGVNILNFSAANQAFITPWFGYGGTDGWKFKQYLLETQDIRFSPNGIDFLAARKPDGDGCKLFELRILS
jgi:hypothetical protein